MLRFLWAAMPLNPRKILLLSLSAAALLAIVGIALVLNVPSFKLAVKEKWHRWKCPAVPEHRSEMRTTAEGAAFWDDRGFRSTFRKNDPNLYYDLEDSLSTYFTEVDGQGVLLLDGRSQAIVRRVGDVSDKLVSISAGVRMKCDSPDPDVRIIIRIDRPDGTLLEWNEKFLRDDEHSPGKWELFNFEWLLRGIHVPPDAQAAIFLTCSERIALDRMDIVFRSGGPLKRPS